uniref:Glycoside hydrolase family 76 protein n=1 Tax=Mycena chlorophos TaxID=658473 RepID=A0ABQ0M7N1_MYCCL|nr:glycoside hydrolase family 76 protein [Mycena chlorophos]
MALVPFPLLANATGRARSSLLPNIALPARFLFGRPTPLWLLWPGRELCAAPVLALLPFASHIHSQIIVALRTNYRSAAPAATASAIGTVKRTRIAQRYYIYHRSTHTSTLSYSRSWLLTPHPPVLITKRVFPFLAYIHLRVLSSYPMKISLSSLTTCYYFWKTQVVAVPFPLASRRPHTSTGMQSLSAEPQWDQREWRKPEIRTSKQDRLALARSAVDVALDPSNIDATGQFRKNPGGSYWWFAGQLYGQMAELDNLMQQTKYSDLLAAYFAEAEGWPERVGFSAEEYGRSAVIAYGIYGDTQFLNFAESAWQIGAKYTLTEQDVKAGWFQRKSTKIAQACSSWTVAGGTFRDMDMGNAWISALATGLSTLLFKATHNQTYLDWASYSLAFSKHHFLSSDVLRVFDALDGSDCEVARLHYAHNYGVLIEGLTIWYSIDHDVNIQAMLSNLIQFTITTRVWQDTDGILSDTDEKRGSAEIAYGLQAAYEYNITKPELHQLIAQYLAVQFNAVTDLSTSPGTNIYTIHWVGPPDNIFDGRGQTAALSILIGSLHLPPDDGHPTIWTLILGIFLAIVTIAVILVVRLLLKHRGSSWSGLHHHLTTILHHQNEGNIRLDTEQEQQEDCRSIQSVIIQDGVPQLDGRIIQEDTDPISGGGNANIYRGTLNRSNGQKIQVAIKVLRLFGDSSMHEATLHRMDREVRVWSQLNHPNVLPFLGICNGLAQWPVLVSPFYNFGHVGEYLKQFPDADRRALTLGAAAGLRYLHDCNMIHGDLKVQNVLVNASHQTVICDFGLSRIIDESGFTSSCVGTLIYMAPELFRVLPTLDMSTPRTTKASDVYSFGLLGLEIYSGQRPTRRPRTFFITEEDLHGMELHKEDIPAGIVPWRIWDLLGRCCDLQPEQRPDMEEIVRSLEAFQVGKLRSIWAWFRLERIMA